MCVDFYVKFFYVFGNFGDVWWGNNDIVWLYILYVLWDRGSSKNEEK